MRQNPWPRVGAAAVLCLVAMLIWNLFDLRFSAAGGPEPPSPEVAVVATDSSFTPCDGGLYVQVGDKCPVQPVATLPQSAVEPAPTELAPQLAPTEPPVELVPTEPPAVMSAPVPTPTPPIVARGCRAVADYELPGLGTLAVGPGEYLHVDFGNQPDGPGLNGVLESGQYTLMGVYFGHAWRYDGACTRDNVLAQMRAHIIRRNTEGFTTIETDAATLAQHFVPTAVADTYAYVPEAAGGQGDAVPQSVTAPVLAEPLGMNVYPPQTAGPAELYVAHGDVDATGSCHLAVFAPGMPFVDLGSGSWRMVRVTGGTPEQRLAKVEEIRSGAEDHVGGPCPNL